MIEYNIWSFITADDIRITGPRIDKETTLQCGYFSQEYIDALRGICCHVSMRLSFYLEDP